MDRFSELQVFLAIVDAGSLSAAARRLHRSPPAVTRILSNLEQRLGTVLLDRTSRRCQLTDAGRQMADRARFILANYEDAISEISGDTTSPRGSVRVTAPLMFGREHVAPAVVEFLDLFASINVELQLADRVIDLHEENFDLAVRIGRVADPTLVARRVGTVRLVTAASPSYLTKRGEPRRPEDILEHDIIQHSSAGAATPWSYVVGGVSKTIRVAPRFTVNQADAAVAAARIGRGLVTALSYQVHPDLVSGLLVRVLRDFEPPALPVSVVYPEVRRSVRRVRLLADHLADRLARLDVLKALG